ncbi:MAG: 30S ribosomal protein S20 [Nitrospirota bacterium]|nr:30S ribosomal protein S20 [Nitrospirota bacterium]
MANHKSAVKRHAQSLKRRARNKMVKSSLNTYIKKVKTAVVAKDTDAAKTALAEAIPVIDKAAAKGVIHRNNAARKVSRLSLAVQSLAAVAAAPKKRKAATKKAAE